MTLTILLSILAVYAFIFIYGIGMKFVEFIFVKITKSELSTQFAIFWPFVLVFITFLLTFEYSYKSFDYLTNTIKTKLKIQKMIKQNKAKDALRVKREEELKTKLESLSKV